MLLFEGVAISAIAATVASRSCTATYDIALLPECLCNPLHRRVTAVLHLQPVLPDPSKQDLHHPELEQDRRRKRHRHHRGGGNGVGSNMDRGLAHRHRKGRPFGRR